MARDPGGRRPHLGLAPTGHSRPPRRVGCDGPRARRSASTRLGSPVAPTRSRHLAPGRHAQHSRGGPRRRHRRHAMFARIGGLPSRAGRAGGRSRGARSDHGSDAHRSGKRCLRARVQDGTGRVGHRSQLWGPRRPGCPCRWARRPVQCSQAILHTGDKRAAPDPTRPVLPTATRSTRTNAVLPAVCPSRSGGGAGSSDGRVHRSSCFLAQPRRSARALGRIGLVCQVCPTCGSATPSRSGGQGLRATGGIPLVGADGRHGSLEPGRRHHRRPTGRPRRRRVERAGSPAQRRRDLSRPKVSNKRLRRRAGAVGCYGSRCWTVGRVLSRFRARRAQSSRC